MATLINGVDYKKGVDTDMDTESMAIKTRKMANLAFVNNSFYPLLIANFMALKLIFSINENTL
tara:strand:- start:2306 stop:2494 length:189 start_codon:yes stop_codon:yes gene_type:complete